MPCQFQLASSELPLGLNSTIPTFRVESDVLFHTLSAALVLISNRISSFASSWRVQIPQIELLTIKGLTWGIRENQLYSPGKRVTWTGSSGSLRV